MMMNRGSASPSHSHCRCCQMEEVAQEVNFGANGITAEGIKAFDGILQSNIYLKVLNLSGNTIGDEGAKVLCDILVNNSGIQKLQLNSTGIGDEGAQAIAELLKKNSTLRTLELNNNLIDYSGFSGLAEALLENKPLQSLYLNGNYGGALGASSLANGLEGNKALRELFLHGNSIDEGVRALITGLSLHKGKLIALDIGNNMITSKGAFHIAEYVKRSKSLLWLNVYMNDIEDVMLSIVGGINGEFSLLLRSLLHLVWNIDVLQDIQNSVEFLLWLVAQTVLCIEKILYIH